MDVGAVELILHLSPDVVVEVLTLLIGTVIKDGLKVDIRRFALGEVDLLDATLANQVEFLHLFICIQITTPYIFQHNLRFTL